MVETKLRQRWGVHVARKGYTTDSVLKKITNYITPWNRLTVPQLVRKFPTFYATRSFITAFIRARHLSLS
jgi:3-hydroxyacyl-CoA dehydrogenase